MIVYHYDRFTKEYIGIGNAFESPLEPGKYLMPGDSTTKKPMACADGYRLLFSGGEWELVPIPEPVTAPEPEQPIIIKSVTPRQAKLALLSAGLLDDVEAAIDAIADPATKRVAQIEWEYAQEVRRDWPLLVQLATSMGMTESDLDELFTQAALL